ncbi:hypothetical protein ACWA2B_19680 [Paenibacillus sp. CMM36]
MEETPISKDCRQADGRPSPVLSVSPGALQGGFLPDERPSSLPILS